MKLSCSQKDLALFLNIVNRAVNPNNALQILNNILFKTEGKKLHISATNLEIAMETSLDCSVDNEGSITIPAKLITNYVSLLKDEKVNLRIADAMQLSVDTDDSTIKIKGLPSEDFPSIPKIEDFSEFTISSKDFKDSIDKVSFSASLNISRPVLTGVLFVCDQKQAKLVSTDSFRLSEKKLPISNSSFTEEYKFIVPSKTMIEISKTLAVMDVEDIDIKVSKNQALFTIGDVKLTTRLVEGNFPDYEKILPKEKKTSVEVSTSELVSAAKKVGLFAAETNNNVRIKAYSSGKIEISTSETQIGEGVSSVNCIVDGEDNETALNAQFLLDVLSIVGDKSLVIDFNDKLSPIKISPKQSKGYLHIIMPLKI